jgi:hypothetical protein
MVDWAGLVAPGSAQQLLRSVVVGWLARFAALVDLDVSAGFWPLGDPTTRATHPPYCYAGIPWCLNLMYSILLQFQFFCHVTENLASQNQVEHMCILKSGPIVY